MKPRALFLAVLLGACGWSNSLYQARLLSGEALRAERDQRPSDAAAFWGRAALKADSAYARSPRGIRGAEAEWLRGRALARGGFCTEAQTGLQVAFVMAPTAPWRESLLLELGRCRESLGDPTASPIFAQLVTSKDSGIRNEARRHAGHAAVMERHWDEALTLLAGYSTPQVHLDRAMALASVHRSSEAVAELTPLITSDTSFGWAPLLEQLAAADSPTTDTMVARLLALPTSRANDERKSTWLLAAARGGFTYDPPAADRRIALLSTRRVGASATEGRLLAQFRLISNAATLGELKSIVSENSGLGGAVLGIDVGEIRTVAEMMVGQDSLMKPGVPFGDMVTFAFAERARETLRAPRLATNLLAQLERDWPSSVYVPKALLARIMVEPDSADALRARFHAHTSSQYTAFLRGEEGPAFGRLEDSLNTFTLALWRRLAASMVPK